MNLFEMSVRTLVKKLNPTKSVLFIDCEATGLNVESDRVVQVAYTQINPDGTVVRNSTLVNPGVSIPKESTEIHHITNEMVSKSPSFNGIHAALLKRLQDAEVVCGYNIKFDLNLLRSEFNRIGSPLDLNKIITVDAQGIFFKMEPRNLEAAMRRYCGVTMEGAHDAQVDVDATLCVLAAQLVEYPEIPTSIPELSLFTLNTPKGAIDHDGKFVWKNGEACISFGKYQGTPLKKIGQDYLRWMLTKGFSKEVQVILNDALNGKFPVLDSVP